MVGAVLSDFLFHCFFFTEDLLRFRDVSPFMFWCACGLQRFTTQVCTFLANCRSYSWSLRLIDFPVKMEQGTGMEQVSAALLCHNLGNV